MKKRIVMLLSALLLGLTTLTPYALTSDTSSSLIDEKSMICSCGSKVVPYTVEGSWSKGGLQYTCGKGYSPRKCDEKQTKTDTNYWKCTNSGHGIKIYRNKTFRTRMQCDTTNSYYNYTSEVRP